MINEPKEKMRVRYASKWLRNTGQYAGEICFRKGTITEVGRRCSQSAVYVKVAWDGADDIPQGVLSCNLELVPGAKP